MSKWAAIDAHARTDGTYATGARRRRKRRSDFVVVSAALVVAVVVVVVAVVIAAALLLLVPVRVHVYLCLNVFQTALQCAQKGVVVRTEPRKQHVGSLSGRSGCHSSALL